MGTASSALIKPTQETKNSYLNLNLCSINNKSTQETKH